MAKLYFLLQELSALEVLQVLAIAAEKILAEPAGKIDGQPLGAIRLRIPQEPFAYSVTLLVPDINAAPGPQKKKETEQKMAQIIIDTYYQVRGLSNQGYPGLRRDRASTDTLPLSKAAAWLLLNSGGDPEEEAAPQVKDQHLVLGRNLDENRAAYILEELRFHATHTYVTTAKMATGDYCYLFHVRDDQQRYSSFLSTVAGDLFGGCFILNSFASNGRVVFLPNQIEKLNQQGLDYFCRLLSVAPFLFVKDAVRAERGLLAAIIDQGPASQDLEKIVPSTFEILYLTNLKFRSQVNFHWPYPPETVEVCDLTAAEDKLDELDQAIAEAEPYIGYRLALRPTDYQQSMEAERERLLEQQLEIEYRLAYLNSIAHPRPTLLRFTQKQLPALADVIRSFPQQIIHDGKLKYGYQAPRYDPADGLHYIFIEPQAAVMTELNPLLLWQDLDNAPMQFWLDPSWARFYHDQGNKYLFFVSEGMALFPRMHSWDVKDMDQYMRQTMQQWYHGQYGVLEIPERPIYIFNHHPYAQTEIQISILNRDKLRPLHTRLGWLNDNLKFIDAVKELEADITQTARRVDRQKITERVKEEANEAIKVFEFEAQKICSQITSQTNELTTVITEQVQNTLDETEKNMAEIKKLNQRLQSIKVVRAEMQKLATQVDKNNHKVRNQTDRLDIDVDEVEKQVDEALNKARHSRKKIYREVSIEIEKLKANRAALQQMLAEL